MNRDKRPSKYPIRWHQPAILIDSDRHLFLVPSLHLMSINRLFLKRLLVVSEIEVFSNVTSTCPCANSAFYARRNPLSIVRYTRISKDSPDKLRPREFQCSAMYLRQNLDRQNT